MRFALSALLLIVAACAPSPGRPRPTAPPTDGDVERKGPRVEGKWRARHWSDSVEPCGGKCRFRARTYSNVHLELQPNGVARAVDEGEMLERFRAATGERSHLTEWDREWTGSWSEGGDELQIQLEPAGLKCSRTSSEGRVEDPCEPLSLVLQCERERIQLTKSSPRTEMAWVCDANQSESPGLSPLPWVFGDERLLVAVDLGRRDQEQRRYYAARPKKHEKPVQ